MPKLIEKLRKSKWLFWLGAILFALWLLKDLIIGFLIQDSKDKVNDARVKDAELKERQRKNEEEARRAKQRADKAGSKVGKPNKDKNWHKK